MSDGPNDGWETVTDPKEAAAAVRAGADKGPVTLTGEPLLSTLDPATASQVKAMAEGRMALPNGMSMRSPQAQKLLGLTAQYDPTFDVANAPARTAARKAFTSGAQGKNITSFNTALGHLGTLAQRTEDLHNSSLPLWNGVANLAESATGDPRVTNFNVAKQAVVDELERAFKGTGGNVHEIRQWEDTINSSRSPAQLRGAIGQAADLLNSRIGAIRDSYNAAMGTTDQPLPMLNQHASDALAAFQSPDYQSKGYQAVAAHPGNSAPPPGDGSPPDSPPASPDGAPPPPAPGGAPIAPTAAIVSPDGSSNFSTPDDQKIAGEAQALLNDPKSTRADFDALASKYGRPAFGDDLDRALALRAKGGSASVLTPVSGRDEGSPTYNGVVNGVLSQTGLDPADVRAAGIAAGDTVSFGTLPKVVAGTQALGSRLTGDNRALGDIYSSDLATANGAVQGARDAHPLAALAGDTAGFIGGDGILSAVPGVARLARAVPAALRPAVGDTLFGAATGLGSSDSLDEVPGNIAKGALLTGAGGAIGRGAARTVGGLLSPIANASVQRLTQAGVTLTPGQILGASGGIVGRAVKGVEDRVAGFPVIGDVINSTRRGGVEDFNRKAINDAVAPINAALPGDVDVGHAGIQHARQTVSDAYDAALSQMRAAPDAQFSSDLSAIGQRSQALSSQGRERLANIMDTDVQPYVAGRTQLDGSDIQAIKQGLDKHVANLTGQGSTPQDRDLAEHLSGVRNAVLDLAGRTDPTSSAAFTQANQAHSLLSRVEGAAAKAKDGVFTPNQFRQAVTKRGYGTTTRSVAAGTSRMQQLATDASTILPNTVPDSGTAGRAALGVLAARLGTGGVLGGAEGYREGGSAGAVAGATIGSALLSRPGARAAQYVLAGSRGRTSNTLGALIRRNADLAGAVGSPLLLSRLSNGGN